MMPKLGRPFALSRRAALLGLTALLGGCGDSDWFDWDSVLSSPKHPLPGKRENVLADATGLTPAKDAPRVVLPQPVMNAAWPQEGGNPAHLMGHLALDDSIAPLWQASIGKGGDFRRELTAPPVVAEGLVVTMDSDATLLAHDLMTGGLRWRLVTRAPKDRSTNIGGGIAADGSLLYAATGRGDLLAVELASGKPRWRVEAGMPFRSAPTVAQGRLYVVTMDQKLHAYSCADGKEIWSHPATQTDTAALGLAAPAVAEDLVIGGFGSGELLAVKADSGTLVWSDTISAGGDQSKLADIASITALPVVDGDTIYAVGLGGLMVAIERHTGRRLWEREITSGQTPWVAGAWAFVVTEDAEIAAIHLADGEVGWVTPLPRYRNPKKQKDPISWIGPLLVGDRLLVGGSNGEILSVSPYDGKILGSVTLKKTSLALPPVAARKTVLFLTHDGTLHALR
jgi:outer membrane protein assembly factor BamB